MGAQRVEEIFARLHQRREVLQLLRLSPRVEDEAGVSGIEGGEERVRAGDGERADRRSVLGTVIAVEGADCVAVVLRIQAEKEDPFVPEVVDDEVRGMGEDIRQFQGRVQLAVELVQFLILANLRVELLLVPVEQSLRLDQPLQLLGEGCILLAQSC